MLTILTLRKNGTYYLSFKATSAIRSHPQQLTILDAFAMNKQQTLTTLTNLQSVGITEKEIIELVGIINRWNRRGLYHNQGSTLDDRLIGH